MDETPVAEVVTPKRRIRVKLPTRRTVTHVAALTGAATLGFVAGVRKMSRDCACESDSAQPIDPTDN